MLRLKRSPRNIIRILGFLFVSSLVLGMLFCQSNNISATTQREIINLGVMVKFSDSDTLTSLHIDDPDSLENAERLLNSDNPIPMQTSAGEISVPSIKKYYETQSYGTLSVITKLFVYQDNQPMDYYLTSDDQQTARENELVEKVIQFVQSQIDSKGLTASTLDSDNDGKIDALTLFIENTTTQRASGIFHPHVNYNKDGRITAKIAGKELSAYAMIYHQGSITESGTFSLNTGGYGTIAHEFGHILGFRDLYRGNDQGANPVGYFDLMGRSPTSNPQNLLAYFTSEYQNWHDPLETINQTTSNITVYKPQFTDTHEKRAVKLQRNSEDKEYFIVEYYEPNDPRGEHFAADSRGIIIYRVNENYRSNGNYSYNGTSYFDHIFVFRPNEPSLNAGKGNIIEAPLNIDRPNLGKDLSNSTEFDNQTIYYTDGTNSGITIKVTKMDTDSVTFDVTFPSIAGNGTQNNPYQIPDVTTFLYLMTGDTKGKYYTITKDLNFQNVDYPRLNFYGNLDGHNHTLSNITTIGSGIFNNIGDPASPSSVKNLKVTNLTVSPLPNNQIGTSLGGFASSIDNATITNVHLLSGKVENSKSAIGALLATGGFAGITNTTTVINQCSSALTVNGDANVAGFIGLNQNASITNSSVTGKVAGNDNIASFIAIQSPPYKENYSGQGLTAADFKMPQNSTYDSKINGAIPVIGLARNQNTGQLVALPEGIALGVTDINATTTTPEIPIPTPTPTPTPDPVPTETEVLTKLGLTKKQNYLFGFNLGTSITVIKQTFANIKGVNVMSVQSNDQIATTNTKLSLRIGNTTYNYTLIIKGDVNGDGKIQATDYVKIRNHIMGKSSLTDASLQAADINQDGKVQATDYVKVRNHIMGKTSITQK